MLTITEESVKYPPDGQIPNLEQDERAFEYVLAKLQPLYENKPELGVSFGTLVTWSSERGGHTHLTWAAAVDAALAGESSVRGQSAQRSTSAGPVILTTETDNVLSGALDRRSSEEVRALKFANCGQTAAIILDLLGAQIPELNDLRVAHTSTPERFDSSNRAALGELLSQVPAEGRILLVDCSFQDIHTFLIEVHSDKRRYLMQGYQEGYLASWWQGTDPAGLALTKPDKDAADRMALQAAKSLEALGQYEKAKAKLEEAERNFAKEVQKYQESVAALDQARARYGNGASIADNAMATFISSLVAAFADGTWPGFAGVWPLLPFCPTADQCLSISHRAAAPRIQVNCYQVKDPGVTGSLAATVIPQRVSDYVKIAK